MLKHSIFGFTKESKVVEIGKCSIDYY